MITTKNNFKAFLHKKYPNIANEAVYGLNAYLLNKPLDAYDAYQYMQHQLQNGKYIVFFGYSPSEVIDLIKNINEKGVPKRNYGNRHFGIPTTFASFVQWCDKHNIHYKNRTFMANASAAECFRRETDINNCTAIHMRRTWYMFEFDVTDFPDLNELNRIPYITIDNTLICLIKASSSRYKSKRQRIAEKFNLMQPVYEQIITAAATDDWDKAVTLANSYVSLQFEGNYQVELKDLKEAYHSGTLQLFLRDSTKMHREDSESFGEEAVW